MAKFSDILEIGVSFAILGVIVVTAYYYEKPLFDVSLTFI